jgi:hypothetical protein
MMMVYLTDQAEPGIFYTVPLSVPIIRLPAFHQATISAGIHVPPVVVVARSDAGGVPLPSRHAAPPRQTSLIANARYLIVPSHTA